MRPIDIGPADLETVRCILREHVPGLEVRAFGSRVSWTARETSDLDLFLMTTEPLDIARTAELRAAFARSNLPFRVDIVDWASTSENFRRVFEREHVLLMGATGESGGWSEATIEDIAASSRNALVGGPFGSNLVSRDYVAEGVPVIRGQNMGARWVAGDFVFVTPQKAESLEANLARPGDIVLTQRGTLGQVSLVPSAPFDRYLVSQSQMKVTVNPEIGDPLFYYYVLSSPAQQEYVRQNAIQTGVPHTNLGILRSTPVPLPPLKEQRVIAHILGSLDEKIELNQRMNETLEAMARALFKSWFVDFDPVRAKMEGRWRRGESLPGLPAEDYDLFPDRLVPSVAGEIPEGWEVWTLGDVAHFNPESWSRTSSPPSVEYVDLANTKWGTIETTQHFLEYLYLACTAPKNIERLARRADGAAYPAVRPEVVAATEVAIPVTKTDLLVSFSREAGPILDRIESNKAEISKCAAQRDALLPKLVSGKVSLE